MDKVGNLEIERDEGVTERRWYLLCRKEETNLIDC
jgi:hypothetical protein